jgi:mannose-6-phosphate isomerase-like protein (cupin superfamily)
MDNPTLINNHRWGTSQYLHVGNTVALAVAHGTAGGASSMHVHRDKHNTFIVRKGKIEIEVQGPRVRKIQAELTPGESHTSPAGEPHRMIFVEDSQLFEMYVATPGKLIDLADIEREDEGWFPPGEEEVADESPQAEPVVLWTYHQIGTLLVRQSDNALEVWRDKWGPYFGTVPPTDATRITEAMAKKAIAVPRAWPP